MIRDDMRDGGCDGTSFPTFSFFAHELKTLT